MEPRPPENDNLHKREIKEQLLRAHFRAVWQLALTYLTDKERAEAVAKVVFKRAFACIDDGEDTLSVSLQLQGFALEEILRLKEAEPAPVMDVYYGATGFYPPNAPYTPPAPPVPPYQPPYQPYYQPAYSYAPVYPPAYAPPAYAAYPPPPQPQYQPPQPQYQPPQPQYQPPQPQPQQPQQPQYQPPQPQQPQPQQPPPQQQQQPQYQPPQPQQQSQPQQQQQQPPKQQPPEPVVAQSAPQEEAWGPAPYAGPTPEELAQKPVERPIEITPEMEARRARRARNAKIILGVNIAAGVLMMWVVLGLLHRIGLLSGLDIGYSWFNETFFKMF